MAVNQLRSRLIRLLIPAGLLALGLFGVFRLVITDSSLFSALHWIAYLNQPLENPEIWRITTDGSQREQLTVTGGKVVDFSVSADGKWIAYTVLNQTGGSDIWLVGSNGKRARRLVNCGVDICSQPAWSPQGKYIAYSRIIKTNNEGGSTLPERIWTVNVKSGHTGALFTDEEITGTSPEFSPDGNQLAFYDTSRQAIQFFDLRSGKSEFLPTKVEEVGAFSPDGARMVFAELETNTLPPMQTLDIVDRSLKNVVPLFGADAPVIDAADPTWSASEDMIVFTARTTLASGRQLWIVNANGSGLRAVTDDVTADHAAASWSPDGTSLVYQQFELSSSDARPDIILWKQADDQFILLARDAALPAWIP